VTAVDRPDNGQDEGRWEGRCSGHGCWYTLPVVGGLIVSHSAPMTLDNCEGSGRPPLAPLPTTADSQQHCNIAEVLHEDGTLVWGVALVKAQQILDRLAAARAGAGEQQRDGHVWVQLPADDIAFLRGFDPDRDRTASRADMVRVVEHLQAALSPHTDEETR